MKKFIATIIYGANRVHGSRIIQVEASSQKVAEKRAAKYAEKEYGNNWNIESVIVEALTPAKIAAIKAKYDELKAITSALWDYSWATNDYAKI